MSGRTTPGAGTKDGSGDYKRIRPQDELEGQHIDELGERDLLVGFRKAHPQEASILDGAMTAQSLGDVAAVTGSSSPHTGKRLLVQACEALRAFREKHAVTMQKLPSCAA